MVVVPETLDAALRHYAQMKPEQTLLTDARDAGQPQNYTWRETHLRAEALAQQFSLLHDKAIGVMLDNSWECLCLVYGVIRSGKDLVLIDPEWGEASKRAIIEQMGLQTLVAAEPIAAPFDELQRELQPVSFPAELPASLATQSQLIIFTSGTTGKPKGIILSQRAMVNAYAIGQRCLNTGEHTRAGCFYRVSGLGILGINFLFPLLFGGSVVLLPLHCWAEDDRLWEYVERFAISFLYMVPPVVNFMVKEGVKPARRYPLSRLLCVGGSARLDPDIQQAYQRDFASLANIYGLSECGFAFLFGRRSDEENFDNSVGPAVGLSLRLVDARGEVIEEPGQRGRLWVKTPSLFSGYHQQPALTASLVDNGWLDTQDIAWFDSDGGYHVLGRADSTINKGGNLFHLNECEQLLNSRDEIADACCLKVPCELYGEDYIAVIHSEHADETELMAWLAHQLGTLRAPRTIVTFCQKLPLNGAGKHDRAAMVALIEGEGKYVRHSR